MKLLIFFLLSLFLLSLSTTPVQAKDLPKTKVKVAQRLEVLREDNSIPPAEILSELDGIITKSSESIWQENLLTAITLKIEILLMFERLSEAETLITEYLPQAKETSLEFIVLRLELSQLTISDAKGFSEAIVKEQQRLLNKAEAIESPRYSAAIYLSVGQSQYVNNNLEGALESLRKAYDIYRELNDTQELSGVMNALANVYIDLNDSNGAIRFYQEAIVIKEAQGDQFSVSILLFNLAKAYVAINELSKAKAALRRSEKISIALEDHLGVLWAKYMLAEVALKEDRPLIALEYFETAAESFRQSGDRTTLFHTLIGQVKALLELERQNEARAILLQANSLTPLLNNTELTVIHTQMLAKLEAADKNYEQAYKAQLLFSDQKSDIFEAQQAQKTENLRIQFDLATKENRNKILESENEIKNLKLSKQQEEKTYWLIIILLAVFIIFVGSIAFFKVLQHRNRFKNMALRDHLTNSPNRRAILLFAQERYNEAKYTDMELSIGIIDLDHFKKINDTYGHETGDETLKAFSDACNTVLRKQDRYGRYGGEEWLLVLSNTNRANIQQIFERIRTQLNQTTINGFPSDETITFSMGIAQYDPEQDDSLQTMINRADKHLYKAKSSGRNQISI